MMAGAGVNVWLLALLSPPPCPVAVWGEDRRAHWHVVAVNGQVFAQ
jgi:hypothetical protein